MANSSSRKHSSDQKQVGQLGEELVAHWLRLNGWRVIARGWHSRWGELDIIAQQLPDVEASQPPMQRTPPCLAFVEVKTRSLGNWDADGLLAITTQKQAKLWKTAQLFLAKHPDLANLPCRFDVALVKCMRSPVPSSMSGFPTVIELGQPIFLAGYHLTLQTYLESAFSRE